MVNWFNAETTADEVLEGFDLAGKTALITGASSGLGAETARALAAHGANVIGSVRNADQAAKAIATVHEAARQSCSRFDVIQMDLANLASIQAATDQIIASRPPIDVIIANAGVMATPFRRTRDGFELQFGTNVLGHFLIVSRLAALMREGGRVVVLSSSAHRSADVDLEDPNFEHTPYDPWVAYARSKTGDALLAVAFDERNKHRGLRGASVHPGGIQTGLGRHLAPGTLDAMVERVNEQLRSEGKAPHRFKSIAQGAATSIWAGFIAPADVIGGQYCENCRVSPTLPDNTTPVGAMDEGVRPYALDKGNADALWNMAEAMVANSS